MYSKLLFFVCFAESSDSSSDKFLVFKRMELLFLGVRVLLREREKHGDFTALSNKANMYLHERFHSAILYVHLKALVSLKCTICFW